MFPLNPSGSFMWEKDRIRSCVFLKGHTKRQCLNFLQMAVEGLMQLAKTDLLCFPKANVYWENSTILPMEKKTLNAYIGWPSTQPLPNTLIKINKNIFHGTCFQPSPRFCSAVAFSRNQICFSGKIMFLWDWSCGSLCTRDHYCFGAPSLLPPWWPEKDAQERLTLAFQILNWCELLPEWSAFTFL